MLLYQQATLRSLGLMQPQQEAHYQDGHVEKLIENQAGLPGGHFLHRLLERLLESSAKNIILNRHTLKQE